MRTWLSVLGAVVFVLGVALALWVHLRAGGSILAAPEEVAEVSGMVLAVLGFTTYLWTRHWANLAALRQLQISGSQLRLLATQVPADVWTTDTELRLTSAFGALIARLENPEARVPGRTVYEVFATRDVGHPVIAAHLRALQGHPTTYERTVGEAVLEGRVEPLRDVRGRVIGCVGVAMDVSAWRWAESKVRWFGALVESSQDAIVSTTTDGTIETWNRAAEKLYGYSTKEAVGRSSSLIFPPGSLGELRRNLDLLARGESIKPYDAERVRKDGTAIRVEVTISPISDGAGRVVGFAGIARDITERKRAEEALRQSEAVFRLMAENATDIITRNAPDGTFRYVSPSCQRLLRYDPEELVGHSPFEFIHPDDVAAATPPHEALHGQPGYVVTFRFRRKDGTYVWLESLGHTECDQKTGAVTEIHAATREITDRKRVDAELRALAQHVESAREEEHTVMAREIHDELAQALSALRLDLSWLAKKAPGGGSAVRAKIVEMVALVDATIEAGRRIAARLRPPILDDLGLVPALEWHVQDFAERSGLRVELDVGPKELVLEGHLGVAVYRIVQEALANVARHAAAKHVTVRLGVQDGALALEVCDDGKGVPDDVAASERSLGFVGMRERAQAYGGTVEITGAPHHGTTVLVSIPIERGREPR